MPQTARAIIDQALLRHWSFPQRRFPPGGALLLVQQACDELLVRYAHYVEPLVGQSVQVAGKVNGTLVGLTPGGVPQYLTTTADGWAVSKTAGGTPYIDFTQAPIATDPLGASSANPGFPLPVDFLKLIACTVVYQDTRESPISVVPEDQRLNGPPSHDPVAYISGNRLVPSRAPLLGGSEDDWTNAVSLKLSYIARIVFASLTAPTRLPSVLEGALITFVAEKLALSAKPSEVTMQEKVMFTSQRTESEKLLEAVAAQMLADVRTDSVIYLG